MRLTYTMFIFNMFVDSVLKTFYWTIVMPLCGFKPVAKIYKIQAVYLINIDGIDRLTNQ